MRVLIVPDKFKGTLTAAEAAAAIAEGWRQGRPRDELDLLPMSDGGDGFGEILGQRLGAAPRTVETVDAAHRPIQARFWWQEARKIALIESAQVIGLAQLPPGRFHPFELDTYGLGAVFRAAAALRPREWFIGIGGSATNDAGFGLARALGWQFGDRNGVALERWTELPHLASVAPPTQPLRLRGAAVAVDVTSPLLGRYGATQVFGPQKGIRPEDIKPAERCFRRLVRVMVTRSASLRGMEKRPGAGAAGGLGFGLEAFLGLPLVPGFVGFARLTQLRRWVRAADLVITGEGAIDLSTVALGKGVGRVGNLARHYHKPCIALAGAWEPGAFAARPFTAVAAIAPTLTSATAAMAEPRRWLAELARRAATAWLADGAPAPPGR